MIKSHWPLLAAMVLGGCVNLAPQYERPEAPVSGQWLPAASLPKGQVGADVNGSSSLPTAAWHSCRRWRWPITATCAWPA
jgi:hypothetical protein